MSPDRFKFKPAFFPTEAFSYQSHMAKGLTKAQAKQREITE